MKTTIIAKSSSQVEPYSVDFILENEKLIVKCSCPAGKFGKFCKHKWGLLKGNYDLLFDGAQDGELDKIQDWVQDSDCLGLIIGMSKAQKALEEAESNLKVIQRIAAEAMEKGFRK